MSNAYRFSDNEVSHSLGKSTNLQCDKSIMDKPWVIYALSDPRNGVVRYVGKANNPKRRLAMHLRKASKGQEHNHRICWLLGLIRAGIRPIISILETGIGSGWQEAEKKWIRAFRDLGNDLVNATDGGEGTEGYVQSMEHRAKISDAMKRTMTPERRARIAETSLGRRHTPESKAKLSAKHRGKTLSPEHRAKLGAAHVGNPYEYKHSLETKAKISASNKGKQPSAETRAKLVAAWVRRKSIPNVGN
jgi:group I intron endonuclease